MNTYKTNNTGIDITQETQSFSIDEIMGQFSKNYRLNNYINVRPDNLTDIDANRVRFNKSHRVSTNNLWALNKNFDLTSQISYSKLNLSVKNIFNQNRYSYTVYDTLTSMNKEYTIRPRNFLASVFFRF